LKKLKVIFDSEYHSAYSVCVLTLYKKQPTHIINLCNKMKRIEVQTGQDICNEQDKDRNWFMQSCYTYTDWSQLHKTINDESKVQK